MISHDDLIGKRARDVVSTASLRSGRPATEYRLHEVKLEEYVRLSRRLVTPIYPSDARLIVELFDIHVQPFRELATDIDEPKLEILEAGTGHGALTLYLSRAIHAANAALPMGSDGELGDVDQRDLDEWKDRRRALVHTVDAVGRYSKHAARVVQGFRRKMYFHNVDFHVADVGVWIRRVFEERANQPFLSHAFLDLPNADAHLASVAHALRTDGCLIIFNPNITQIMDCIRKVKEDGIALELDNVIELGVNGGSGGREWNVRAVKRKANMLADSSTTLEGEVHVSSESINDIGNDEEAIAEDARESPEPTIQKSTTSPKWAMVCRPKVGERVVGGGFLAVFKKQRDMT